MKLDHPNQRGHVALLQYCSTRKLAEKLDIRSDSLRKMLSERGHVYGMRPIKLPSGRNLWSVAEIQTLLARCANGGLGKEGV
jgi:hypothetical protein